MAYNATKDASNVLRVLPCDAIQQYSKDKPAPTNSSGWYVPSFVELRYVCEGQGGGTTGRDNLNSYINKVGGTPFGNDRYWSSTECRNRTNSAWYVYFYTGVVITSPKVSSTNRVRPLLAF